MTPLSAGIDVDDAFSGAHSSEWRYSLVSRTRSAESSGKDFVRHSATVHGAADGPPEAGRRGTKIVGLLNPPGRVADRVSAVHAAQAYIAASIR
jgi:hypothetical protein